MIDIIAPLATELEQESEATRRMLGRVPEERLDWRPHERSMSLGELANHVARLPGEVAAVAEMDEFDVADARFDSPPAASRSELLEALDRSLQGARACLESLTEERALGIWRLRRGEVELMAMPRVGLLRAILLNHWYHHRGQLSVYLRLLDVPVPVTYGRTADEDPFAAA
ncbi:MAG: DinB family protein [Gemmatimonadota bacterium]